MKIKQLPEDFVVEEQSTVTVKDAGSYQVFRLTKKGLDTFSAKRILGSTFKISSQEMGVAGLKDRHALTSQFISFPQRVRIPRLWKEKSLGLEWQGFSDAPIRLGDLSANRFGIVVRDVKEEEIPGLIRRAREVFRVGTPNYFDNQRFGSLRGSKEFIAKHLIQGDLEGALKVLLTSATRHDPAPLRRCRRLIAQQWGDWTACMKCCAECKGAKREQRVLSFLIKRPSDVKGAWALVPSELVKLYFAAYQSFLWNETVTVLLKRLSPDTALKIVPYHAGQLLLPMGGSLEGQPPAHQTVPLLHKGVCFPDEQTQHAALKVLREEGVSLDQLECPGIPNQGFKEGSRPWWVVPSNCHVGEKEVDELNSKAGTSHTKGRRFKLKLMFDLPPGSYATMVLKAIGIAKKGRQH